MEKRLIVLLFFLTVLACRSGDMAATNQRNANLVAATAPSNVTQAKAKESSPKSVSYGQIVSCLPEKLSSGKKLVITLKSPNGGYLAVKREGQKPDYYLLSAPEGSKEQEFAAAADTLPLWQVETLKTLNRIELNSATARAVNLSKLNNRGEGKAELIFNQTGWYEILLSDENFEQDDPIITGQCRLYFDKTKDVSKNVQTSEIDNIETINWNSETQNLSFQTTLTLKNSQPFAFTLSGSRIFLQNNSETANECYFAVESEKNNTVWKTENGRTVISGKDELGTTFQMFIRKTNDGFLIDTSAAAQNCFNVGMPGNILLTKAGSQYNGRFVAFK